MQVTKDEMVKRLNMALQEYVGLPFTAAVKLKIQNDLTRILNEMVAREEIVDKEVERIARELISNVSDHLELSVPKQRDDRKILLDFAYLVARSGCSLIDDPCLACEAVTAIRKSGESYNHAVDRHRKKASPSLAERINMVAKSGNCFSNQQLEAFGAMSVCLTQSKSGWVFPDGSMGFYESAKEFKVVGAHI